MPDPASPHWGSVKEIFRCALTLPESERAAFLESACGANTDVRREVLSLLGALADAGSLVEGAAVSQLGDATVDPLLGQRVGAYRVLAEIGRGGMGAVYCAVRDDDVFRKNVALKVMRGGLTTAFHRESFHQERQILAGLQHPNVAQLLDGGTTDDGRPYLVMELVAGEPIDVYCERRGVSVRERLELFRHVCAAVQCAHQSLVVHRDLKPANILVGADGVPKLLDFGIAKLLPAQGGDATVTEVRALTPLYASPEQLLGQSITTASDVYSLGVVLYELLTGRRPFDLDGRPAEDLVRRISHDEPARPSAAMPDTARPAAAETAHVPDTVTAVASGTTRMATPARPRAGRARELRGDLDTIVMTALAKEPSRRYGSAAALAEDLRRHLEGLPIAARKPTLVYRTGKFVRRHPGGVAAAALLLASLLAGIATTTAEWRRAEAERVRAERQVERATAVTTFLKETMGAAHPETGLGRSATVLEALEAARARLGEAFEGSPDIRAAVQVAIGETYGALGRYDEAEALLRAALETQSRELGEESSDVAETLRVLGDLLMQKGQLDQAETHLKRALALRESLHGAQHMAVAHTLNSLGMLHWTRGDNTAAVRDLHRAQAIVEGQPRPDQLELALTLGNLAPAVEVTDPAEAVRIYRRALAIWTAWGRTRSAGYVGTASNLGLLLRDQGDYAGAEPLLREALALDRELMGDRHANVATSLTNLGGLLRDRGDPVAARPLFIEAIAILRASLGEGHWVLARARENLGVCFLREGRWSDAEHELLAAEAGLSQSVGANDERTLRAVRHLVELYEAWKRPADAARFRTRVPPAGQREG